MDTFSTNAIVLEPNNSAFSLLANVDKLITSLGEAIPSAHSIKVVVTTSLGLSSLKSTIKTSGGTKLKVIFVSPLKGQLDNTVKLTYRVD